MPPVRPPPDVDAGGLPALELAWLSAGGAVAPLVPPLSPQPPPPARRRCLPEVLRLLVSLQPPSSLLPVVPCKLVAVAIDGILVFYTLAPNRHTPL
jgi:hypothetical protein